MGDDVNVNPEGLLNTAAHLDESAGRVRAHHEAARSRGRVGHGPIGELFQGVVRRAEKVVEDVTETVAKAYEDSAKGLRKVAHQTSEDDARAKSAFDRLGRRSHDDVHPRSGVGKGRHVPNEAGPKEKQIPQGLTERQFSRLSRGARQLCRAMGLPKGELVIQGSRVRGAAHNLSDLDVALRVDDKSFFELSERALARAPMGTKLRKSMLRRINENGQLSSFDLGTEFTRARTRLVDPHSPHPIQFSVIRRGGKIDTPPFIRIG